MKFFVDNNIAPRIVQALNVLAGKSNDLIPLIEVYPKDVKDEVWLSEIRQKGFNVIISGDRNIFKKPHQRQLLDDSELPAFFLTKGWFSLEFWTQAYKHVIVFQKILDNLRRYRRHKLFEITVNLKIIRK